MLTYTLNGLSVDIEFDRYTFGDRCAWKATIRDGAKILHTDTGLETPIYDMIGALRSLHSFLSAWVERGESADLFPAELLDKADWSRWLDESYGDLYPPES